MISRTFPKTAALLCLLSAPAIHAEDPLELANPLVGTASLDDPKLLGNAPPPGEEAYSGFTWPGPALPHRNVIVGPINKDLTEAAGNHGIIFPYVHARRTMLGFSSPMPGLTIMPVVGNWNVPPDRSHASPYNKQTEKASPGYYAVDFPDTGIHCELATTERTGYYRFTFPDTRRGTVLIDLGADTNSRIEVVGDRTIRGWRGRGGFVAEFSKPFGNFGVFRQNQPQLEGARVRRDDRIDSGERTISGSYAGSFVEFDMKQGEQVEVRITSAWNMASAAERLKEEPTKFDEAHQTARAAWAEKLGLIEIEGGTEKQREMFYSTLYHSLLTPRLISKKGETNRGGVVAEHDRYTPIALWDTGRNQVALLTLLEPEVKQDILRSHLAMARETGYMHTSFHGDNGVIMYLGDWVRGLPFDYEAVYEFLRKNATDPNGPRGELAEYLEKGWIHDDFQENGSPPRADGNAGCDKTLEYAWSDHAMALFAKKLGKEDDYQMFLKRANNYKNVYDASTGFMRGRTRDGSWITPFDPFEPYYNYMFKEASGWQSVWLVPHDVQGLIELMGGRDTFTQRLDTFFSTPYTPKGIARDVTGMLGLYSQGNQPDQHAPYLYCYAGQPWKTQALTRELMRLMYGSDKFGLAFPGMDDQGATAAWYVLSALGFYTVDPSSPNYVIGSPLFEKATIHLGGGKDLVIVAEGNSTENPYIQSATLNGKPWNKPWFSHADIADGATLVFKMGSAPQKSWGSAPQDAPPSMTPVKVDGE
ncbi:MAG: GH92 family glycosyl hydrolase [Verrucomicrobiota bacterium]